MVATIYAVRVDSLEQAKVVAGTDVAFHFAYEGTVADGDRIGAW